MVYYLKITLYPNKLFTRVLVFIVFNSLGNNCINNDANVYGFYVIAKRISFFYMLGP